MLTIRKSSGWRSAASRDGRGLVSGALEQRAAAVDRAVGAPQQRCELVRVAALDQGDVGVQWDAAAVGLGLDLRRECRDALGGDRDGEALLAGVGCELEHDVDRPIVADEQRGGGRQPAVPDGCRRLRLRVRLRGSGERHAHRDALGGRPALVARLVVAGHLRKLATHGDIGGVQSDQVTRGAARGDGRVQPREHVRGRPRVGLAGVGVAEDCPERALDRRRQDDRACQRRRLRRAGLGLHAGVRERGRIHAADLGERRRVAGLHPCGMLGEAPRLARVKAAEVDELQGLAVDRVAARAVLECSGVEVPVGDVDATIAQHLDVEVVDGQVQPPLVDETQRVCVGVMDAVVHEALPPPVKERACAPPDGEKAAVELPEAQEGVLVGLQPVRRRRLEPVG